MTAAPEHSCFRKRARGKASDRAPHAHSIEDRAALVEPRERPAFHQVTSFVHPEGAAVAVAERCSPPSAPPGVRYEALWLNERGFHRARKPSPISTELVVYARTASRIATMAASPRRSWPAGGWLELYEDASVPLSRATIVCAFGSYHEGDISPESVVSLARRVDEMCRARGMKLPEITLGDTVGWANPDAVQRLVGALRDALPDIGVGLHLHDTRGLGAANVLAALEMGVSHFDSSIAGLGGCPFASLAARPRRNIFTEDMAFLSEENGNATGLDIDRLVEAARLANASSGARCRAS